MQLPEREQMERLDEIESLYSAITGETVKCKTGCNFYGMQTILINYLNLQKPMATSTNYTWNKDYKGVTISDVRYAHNVNEQNLTDSHAEALIKLGYDHIIQKATKAKTSEGETEGETKTTTSTKKGK